MQKKTKRKLGLSFFLIAIPISLIISITLVSILLFFAIRSNYMSWERKFEDSHLSTDYVKIEKSMVGDVDKLIASFKESQKDIDFIEIDKVLFTNLLATNINENMPSNIRIKKGYVEASKGFWKIYYLTSVPVLGDVWIYFDLNKDTVESTDVYITDMKLGNLSVRDWGGDSVISSVNNGIKEAMILITQKDFTGRTIRNIELDTESLIIKGEK